MTAIPAISFIAWSPSTALFGANVEAGTDLIGDGPKPSFGTVVKIFIFDGNQTEEWVSFDSFPGLVKGSQVAAGSF